MSTPRYGRISSLATRSLCFGGTAARQVWEKGPERPASAQVLAQVQEPHEHKDSTFWF